MDDGVFHIVNQMPKRIDDLIAYIKSLFKISGMETCRAGAFVEKPKNGLEILFDTYLEVYGPYMRDAGIFADHKAQAILSRNNVACPDFDFDVFSRCMKYAIACKWGTDCLKIIDLCPCLLYCPSIFRNDGKIFFLNVQSNRRSMPGSPSHRAIGDNTSALPRTQSPPPCRKFPDRKIFRHFLSPSLQVRYTSESARVLNHALSLFVFLRQHPGLNSRQRMKRFSPVPQAFLKTYRGRGHQFPCRYPKALKF